MAGADIGISLPDNEYSYHIDPPTRSQAMLFSGAYAARASWRVWTSPMRMAEVGVGYGDPCGWGSADRHSGITLDTMF